MLASFCHLGFISDPLIVSKFHNETHDPKGQEIKSTRGDQKVRGKWLPFLDRLINRARITAHNTATHMQLISYNMLGVSRLRALQWSSRQRYITRTGPFYVAF